MKLGAASPAPQFADVLAAAAARRVAGASAAAPYRLAGPSPVALPLPFVGEGEPVTRLAGPVGGYAEIRALAATLPIPEALDAAATLAAASRALRMMATAEGVSPRDLAQVLEIAPHDRMPSRNAAQSESAVKDTMVLHDEARGIVTVDVHAARLSDKIWEVAVFDQSGVGPAGFPYAAPPLLVAHAAFDPVGAEFVAAGMIGGALSPRVEQATALVARRPGIWTALVVIGTIVALALALASPLAGLVFVVAILVGLRWLDLRTREYGDG